MNNRHITWPRSSFQMTLLLVGIAVVGIGTSMLLTDDPRWLQWHLSRLGEGGHISSGIFNLTLCLVALLFVVIGERLYAKIGARAWLLRLGYGGADLKEERGLLLRNLKGHSAFPNDAAAERHKEKYAALRRASREADTTVDAQEGGVQVE